ncbi:Ferroporti-1 [Xylariales sp. AK1849]|nr:Ferroporti-1 [Xylariales sp. AK1849]
MNPTEAIELPDEHGNTQDEVGPIGLTRSQAAKLYISHTFSTWNARGYEFAAVLFTAAAYPDTLVAAALRMIIIYIAMILFSSSIGNWVQRTPNRLKTLLTTIVVNRGSVIIGSFFWLVILSQEDLVGSETTFVLPKNDAVKHLVFTVAVAFGIIERLSASGNLISMERDWVVTAAAPAGRPYDLTHLNAVMRRIDLTCKLISPLIISWVITAQNSPRIGVIFTALTSMISIPIEFISAKRVWDGCSALQVPKAVPPEAPVSSPRGSVARIRQSFRGFEMYFSTIVWIPSFSLAMLHVNVMTWRATFITSMINMGYSLLTITIARTVGSLFEITSTIVTPRGIEYTGRPRLQRHIGADDEDELEVGLIDGVDTGHEGRTLTGLKRFGLWGVTWQLLATAPIVVAIWMISNQREEGEGISAFSKRIAEGTSFTPNVGWTMVLFSFLAISRFGVWVFDLTTQQLTQTLVPEHQRSSFAGVENSVVNIFEVCGAGAAIAFPKVEQFKWLCLASLVTVFISWVMYAAWVRGQRGHLVHWEKLGLGS